MYVNVMWLSLLTVHNVLWRDLYVYVRWEVLNFVHLLCLQSTSLPLSPLPVSLHGSLLVQNTLQYQDTKLVTSLLVGLPLPSLTHLACHPNGSHVLEAVLSSKMVDSRKKQKLVDKFKVCIYRYAHVSIVRIHHVVRLYTMEPLHESILLVGDISSVVL